METSKFAREGSRYKAFQREGVRCVNVHSQCALFGNLWCRCGCVCMCVLGEEID